MPRWLQVFLALLVAVALIWAIAAPFGPVPGIRIGGAPSAAPQEWPTRLPDEVLFKTSSGPLPRVVTIWVIEDANDLYVFGAKASGWVRGAMSSPEVQMRIEDRTYDLTATALDNPSPHLFEKYIARYEPDYPDIIAGMPSVEEAADVGVIFRLTRR